jgi:hypothetical protein
MVDQRVCGSVHGGVEMTEEDSTAVKGAGSALLGMGTSADWTEEDVGVHSNVLGDAGDVAGYFDSRNHVVTCSKRVFGLASGDVVIREVSLSCRDVGHKKVEFFLTRICKVINLRGRCGGCGDCGGEIGAYGLMMR